MASPAIASVVATNGSTAASNPTIPLPSGLTSGDLCVVFFSVTQTHGTPTTPTGWTALAVTAGTDSSRSGDRDQVLYRWCDGTEGTSLQVSTNSTSLKHTALALRITGGDTVVNPTISTLAIGTSTQPNPGSVTPAATRDTLFLAWGAIEGTAGAPASAPTNYTHPSTFTANTTGGGSATNQRQCVAYRQVTNTGAAEDPGAWGAWGASEDWLAFAVAISAPSTAAQTVSPAALGGATIPAPTINQSVAVAIMGGATVPAPSIKQSVAVAVLGGATVPQPTINQTVVVAALGGATTPAPTIVASGGPQTVTPGLLGGATVPSPSITQTVVVLAALGGATVPAPSVLQKVAVAALGGASIPAPSINQRVVVAALGGASLPAPTISQLVALAALGGASIPTPTILQVQTVGAMGVLGGANVLAPIVSFAIPGEVDLSDVAAYVAALLDIDVQSVIVTDLPYYGVSVSDS